MKSFYFIVFVVFFEEFYVGDELYGIYYQDDHMKRLIDNTRKPYILMGHTTSFTKDLPCSFLI